MTSEELLQIFETRSRRFKFLDGGLAMIAPKEKQDWVEVGCNKGDATAYAAQKYGMNVSGVDYNALNISVAQKKYPNHSFFSCNAECTPFKEGSFDGIFSEAAFSLIENKAALAREYWRILKKGGFVLINDFALKEKISKAERDEYAHIPCFSGVGFPSEYIEYFKGFDLVHCEENYGELLAIVMHLSKKAGVKPIEIGELLSRYYNIGREKAACPFHESRGMMARAKLTYTRIILKKSEREES